MYIEITDNQKIMLPKHLEDTKIRRNFVALKLKCGAEPLT